MKKLPSIITAIFFIVVCNAQIGFDYSGQTQPGNTKVLRLVSMRLEWTYFIGGSGEEQLNWTRAPYLDRDGMLYFTGTTKSFDFPITPDALYPTYEGGSQRWGTEDVFLVKFNTLQPGIVYSTFLGGAKGPEHAADIYVDHSRNVYIVGNTGSSDFPTTDDALIKQFQGPDFRHADGFLTILSNDGRKLKYSTFIGGPKNDGVSRVFVEPSGEMTLFGITESPGFPSVEVIREAGLKDGPTLFAMRLDAKGQRVLCSHLLANAWGTDVQRLESGDFLVAGSSNIPDFASGAGTHWRRNIFIMRLTADLKMVSFTTMFGGAGEESLPKIATVAGGDFFVFGKTTSKDLPVTADAIEKTMEGKEAIFLARFSGDGKHLKYCSYLGAKGEDVSSSVKSLIYDGRSRIYLAGTTTSPHLPVTPNAMQAEHHGGQDAFLLAFNIADNSLAYGSYLGGSKDEWNPLLALDENGALYMVGATNSDDFPSLEKTPAPRKGMDVFISKFSLWNEKAKEKP